ncbi:hypothetical protein KC207_14700 [Phycicoccus sp. BSK3Z-2]|uniref:Fibronectin type III domain-containing protein n=1 Tax=Phycicoccus avicenniae TaxID=2828860 RepID=A0A941DCN5_9MICO|nr:hypothetical protein [Phycicoccus avicenniae]MBR7744542.1 hypothetical protein [Phycicoccus avicenniae]
MSTRRALAVLGGVVLAGLLAPPASGVWDDVAGVRAGVSSAVVLTPPPTTRCTSTLTTATVSWDAVDPRYRYTVTLYRTGTPRTVVEAATLLPAGQTSVTYGSLLSLGNPFEVEVRSAVAGTAWTSAAATTSGRFNTGLLGGCR